MSERDARELARQERVHREIIRRVRPDADLQTNAGRIADYVAHLYLSDRAGWVAAFAYLTLDTVAYRMLRARADAPREERP